MDYNVYGHTTNAPTRPKKMAIAQRLSGEIHTKVLADKEQIRSL